MGKAHDIKFAVPASSAATQLPPATVPVPASRVGATSMGSWAQVRAGTVPPAGSAARRAATGAHDASSRLAHCPWNQGNDLHIDAGPAPALNLREGILEKPNMQRDWRAKPTAASNTVAGHATNRWPDAPTVATSTRASGDWARFQQSQPIIPRDHPAMTATQAPPSVLHTASTPTISTFNPHAGAFGTAVSNPDASQPPQSEPLQLDQPPQQQQVPEKNPIATPESSNANNGPGIHRECYFSV